MLSLVLSHHITQTPRDVELTPWIHPAVVGSVRTRTRTQVSQNQS
jgi:hypothetical protein